MTQDKNTNVESAGRPPQTVISIINPILRFLLRSPLHFVVSDMLMLIRVTGRKTGKEYTFPVGYERKNDTLVVASHHTNWWKNLRGGGQEVTVWLKGERRKGHAEVTEDKSEVVEYVQGYLERNGLGGSRRLGLNIEGDSVPSREELRRVVDDIVVVYIDLNSEE